MAVHGGHVGGDPSFGRTSARNQRLELSLELGELGAVPADTATERVERLFEALALDCDKLVQFVPLGFELADPQLELLRVQLGCLGLAGELRRELRERLPVLLELSAGRHEVGLELRDDVGLSAPPRLTRR